MAPALITDPAPPCTKYQRPESHISSHEQFGSLISMHLHNYLMTGHGKELILGVIHVHAGQPSTHMSHLP